MLASGRAPAPAGGLSVDISGEKNESDKALRVKAVEDVEDSRLGSVEEEFEGGGPSKPVEEDVEEDGPKPVEDVEDGGPSKPVEDDDAVDESTTLSVPVSVPAREVVPRCTAFPRAADVLQISSNSLK